MCGRVFSEWDSIDELRLNIQEIPHLRFFPISIKIVHHCVLPPWLDIVWRLLLEYKLRCKLVIIMHIRQQHKLLKWKPPFLFKTETQCRFQGQNRVSPMRNGARITSLTRSKTYKLALKSEIGFRLKKEW